MPSSDEYRHVEGTVELVPKPTRQEELEARFCALLNEKLRHEEAVRGLHDEMMRVQGALAELTRLPDAPKTAGEVGGGR
jgi:hypothetical protein